MASSFDASPRPCWRLVKSTYTASAFDGEGAREHGGRWNSPGQRAVYVGSSLALCVLELLVHLDPSAPIPSFHAFAVDLPADLIDPASPALPLSLAQSRRYGDRWLRAGLHPALAVPSVVVPLESNYLLNPAHPAFARLTIAPPVPLRIDPRLLAGA